MPDIVSKLSRKLKSGDKVERCGLILNDGRIVAVKNRHPNPAKGFVIGTSSMKRHIKDLAGTWHTHIGNTSHMSQDDYFGFSGWPGIIHYVIGTDGVRAYRAEEDGLIMEVDLAAG